jgi:hypothetical protein
MPEEPLARKASAPSASSAPSSPTSCRAGARPCSGRRRAELIEKRARGPGLGLRRGTGPAACQHLAEDEPGPAHLEPGLDGFERPDGLPEPLLGAVEVSARPGHPGEEALHLADPVGMLGRHRELERRCP